MASKPYLTEGQLLIATEELRDKIQKLINSGVISKNPIFETVTIKNALLISDEGCLIDESGNAILANKQEKLISGENIRTVNGKSLLGEGNLIIDGSGTAFEQGEGIIITADGKIKVDFTKVQAKLVDTGESQNIKTINGQSILGTGDLVVEGELKPEYEDYLKKVTFKTPTISQLVLLDASGNAVSGGTYEDKTTFTVAKFKHTETNINNIEGNLTMEGKSVTPSATSATVEFDSAISVNSNKTFSLTGVDTLGGSVSKSVAFSFARYAYSNVTPLTTAPTSGNKLATESSFASSGATFAYAKNDYLYLYGSKASMKIETNVLNQWVEVEFESLGSVDEFTQANGKTNKMYAYRVGPFMTAGSAQYRLK